MIGIHSVQRYMDSEIRAIMAQYMPLDSNQGEFSNHVPHGGVWRWSMKRRMKMTDVLYSQREMKVLLLLDDGNFLFHFLHWELFSPFTESYLCIHDRAHKHRTWQLFLGTGTWWISIGFFVMLFFYLSFLVLLIVFRSPCWCPENTQNTFLVHTDQRSRDDYLIDQLFLSIFVAI